MVRLRMPGRSPDGRDFLFRHLPRRAVGAEIGVWRGDFTARLLRRARPRTLHLIDPWQHQEGIEYEEAWYGGRSEGQHAMDGVHDHVAQRFHRQIGAGRVVVHRAPANVAAKGIEDGSLDWVYIDGDHRYEAVKDDLHAYLPKLRAGGVLAGDDYGEGGWWAGGVKRAVDEFVAEGHATLIVQRARQFVLHPNGSDAASADSSAHS